MPFGSLTADQEMPKGTVTCAPLAGEISDGAGGPLEPVGVGVADAEVAVRVGVDVDLIGVGVGVDVRAGVGVGVGVRVPRAETCCGSPTARASRSELVASIGASRVFFLIADLLHTNPTRAAVVRRAGSIPADRKSGPAERAGRCHPPHSVSLCPYGTWIQSLDQRDGWARRKCRSDRLGPRPILKRSIS